jgi:putative methionine-R-sulfoxide reductase with GAF domain
MGESKGGYDFLDKAVGVVMDIIGADAGVVLMREKDNTLKITALRAQAPYLEEKKLKKEFENITIPVSKAGVEKILDGTEAISIKEGNNIKETSYRIAISDVIGKIDMVCAVPVIKDDRISGILELYNIMGSFTKDKKEAFASIGGQLGVYSELFFRLSALKNQANTLRQMVSVTEAISSPSQMGAVLEMIIKNSLDFFTADGCSILLKDRNGRLNFEAVSGDKSDTLKGKTLEPGEGIVGEVVQTGEVKLVADVSEEGKFSSRIDGITHMETGSVICSPLKIADQTIGAIEIIRAKSARPFSEEDTGLLVILAAQASITIDKARMYSMKDRWFNSTIYLLVKMINAKDKKFPEHTDKVRELCRLMGEKLELESEQLQRLDIAASIQNIAKLIIPDRILKKETELSPEEWEEVREHPVKSSEMLETLDEFPIIKYHHEKYDGTGYPEGLREGEIPELARILNIADSFTAMTSERPYRKAMSPKEALENIRAQSGKQYEPKIADLFLKLMDKENPKG